jgi:hypothetical protein
MVGIVTAERYYFTVVLIWLVICDVGDFFKHQFLQEMSAHILSLSLSDYLNFYFVIELLEFLIYCMTAYQTDGLQIFSCSVWYCFSLLIVDFAGQKLFTLIHIPSFYFHFRYKCFYYDTQENIAETKSKRIFSVFSSQTLVISIVMFVILKCFELTSFNKSRVFIICIYMCIYVCVKKTKIIFQ